MIVFRGRTNGTIGKRIARRAAGRATSKLMKNIFK